MNKLKRGILILALILTAMLILPVITVHTVRAEAGMLVTLLLFFVVHPVVSVVVGILAGKEIKFFWASPIAVAGLFWIFSCLAYQPAFPAVYSVAYFAICTVSMVLTWAIHKKIYHK